uniref:Solute carrier organic anion transporter family member n=1 Tax=Parascaris univalens TaxID=6257 RepID=A0A915AKG0_PARUN
ILSLSHSSEKAFSGIIFIFANMNMCSKDLILLELLGASENIQLFGRF